ncbi:hypothetical protein F5B20DRAFT_557623 [Whalleya microplaca]|nr:hypothetical protein F5B20DRAFT_557623 [Whalleya microplaca]
MALNSIGAKQYTQLLNKACRANFLPEIQSVLERARTSSPSAYPEVLRDALQKALYRACSIEIISYLVAIERTSIDALTPSFVARSASIPALEILVAHGWDVNRGRDDGETVLYYVLHDEAVVRWLVDHGADVALGDVDYLAQGRFVPRPAPLLEACAERGSLASFRLLLERGAQVSRRTLHCAALTGAESGADPAAVHSEQRLGEDAEAFEYRRERERILRFLVEERGLNVNQMDSDVPAQMHWGTSINYAAKSRAGVGVVRWLLTKGADPTIKGLEDGSDAEGMALTWAKSEEIMELTRNWKRGKPTGQATDN